VRRLNSRDARCFSYPGDGFRGGLLIKLLYLTPSGCAVDVIPNECHPS